MNSEESTHRQKHKMIKKKAQEEMVGFVMIMVLVAVIFLIFLSISLRKGPTEGKADSEEISQFLDSVLEYSVEDCSFDYKYLSLREVLIKCHNEENCPSGEPSCEVLERTLTEIIASSWHFSQTSPETGYQLDVCAEPACSPETYEIFDWTTCQDVTHFRGAEEIISVQDGSVSLSLKICLQS